MGAKASDHAPAWIELSAGKAATSSRVRELRTPRAQLPWALSADRRRLYARLLTGESRPPEPPDHLRWHSRTLSLRPLTD
jgi:hypothetical protein